MTLMESKKGTKMAFVDGVVIAVPTANRAAYIAHAELLADLFLASGATEVVDCWGADVPEGKLTSFPLAVKATADETVVFTWITWPDKAIRDSGWAKVMEGTKMIEMPPGLYDGKRMIYGGFERVQYKSTGN